MASEMIKLNPGLTKEKLQEIFSKQFAGKYEVYSTKWPNFDFVVKKSAFAGVFVKLKQKKDKTEVVYFQDAPNALVRASVGVLIKILAGKDVFKDVTNLLKTSPELV
jgi:hypothetical protein